MVQGLQGQCWVDSCTKWPKRPLPILWFYDFNLCLYMIQDIYLNMHSTGITVINILSFSSTKPSIDRTSATGQCWTEPKCFQADS